MTSCVFCDVVYLHINPRYRGDEFGFRFGPGYRRRPERTALEEVATSIRRALEG